MKTILQVHTAEDFEELTQLWEAAVRSTHHFLTTEDILFFKPLVRNNYLPALDVYVIKDEQGKIAGFTGLSEEMIEMLFIRPDAQGKG